MMTFRKDTSFPFLKIAHEAGVPYAKVLDISDRIEDGRYWRASDHHIAMLVLAAVKAEHSRRFQVTA